MSKILRSLKQLKAGAPSEPPVHFHRGMTEDAPEVCYDLRCSRPHLAA
jgi:hypothetical protein